MVSVPKLQLKHLRNALRMLFVMLCGSMIFDMLDPAFLILTSPNTMMYRVAAVTHQRELVSLAYVGAAAMIVPFMSMHLFDRWYHYSRLFTKMALAGLMVSAAEWTFLCYMSWRIETGWAVGVYIRTVVGTLMFAGFLGTMLNNELRRERELEEQRKNAEEKLIRRLNARVETTTKGDHDVQQRLELLEQSSA